MTFLKAGVKRFGVASLAVALIVAGVLTGATPAFAVTTHYYAGGVQSVASADGVFASTTVKTPYIDTTRSAFTLMELSADKLVGSPAKSQVIETGYAVYPGVFGDTNSHIFVSHWVDGMWAGCYTAAAGCGFTVNAGADHTVGETITAGTNLKFGIQYFSNAWWVWVGPTSGSCVTSCWVGYFDDTVWTSAGVTGFTTLTKATVFGESTTTSATINCTDMGSGDFGSSAPSPNTRAFWGSVSYVNGPTVNIGLVGNTNAGAYDGVLSGTAGNIRTVFIGGPGTSSTGTTPGTKGSC